MPLVLDPSCGGSNEVHIHFGHVDVLRWAADLRADCYLERNLGSPDGWQQPDSAAVLWGRIITH